MTMSNRYSELKVKDTESPIDTVQTIIWDYYNIRNRGFLIAGWDGYVRYYIIQGNSIQEVIRGWQFFFGHPVICCDMSPNNVVLVGLANGDIVAVSMQNNGCLLLGNHNAPICGIFWVHHLNMFFTVGMDNLLRFWTLQQNNGQFLQMQYQLPDKIYAVSFDYPYILLCSRASKIGIISLQSLPNLVIADFMTANESLDYYSKINCCKINAIKKTYCLGTLDGRLVIGQFRTQNNYTCSLLTPTISKVQRKEIYKKSLSGQANGVDIGIQSSIPYYVTCGTFEGTVYNFNKKQRAKTLALPPTGKYSFTACRISPEGQYIAYAVGNDWCEGINEIENSRRPKVYISKLTSVQLKGFVSR